jgi:hypothetical protein
MSTQCLQRVLLMLWLAAGATPVLCASTALAQDDFGLGDETSTDAEAETSSEDEPPSDDTAGDAGDESSESTEAVDESGLEGLATPAGVRIQAFAGGGMGMRSFRRTVRDMGVQRMDDVSFPAVDAGLRVRAWPADSFALEFLLHYETSIGMSVEQDPQFALENDVSIRASRVELSIAPTFRLGDGPSSVALLFPLGFGLRTLWPEVHTLPVPGYTLGGPQARAELEIPFLEIVTLRLGPEAQWIVMIDQSLQEDRVGYLGVAIGGEALLQVQISTLVGLEFAYRESHAMVPTSVSGETFFDIERFITGRLSGTW